MPDGPKDDAAARILIAEDEAIVAEDLALTLQDLGYQVVGTASDGELAVQLTEESKPDLILMDIKLRGEIDGIEASEQIRARFDVPVIFLTAYEQADVISRAKVTEPYGFLAKPFSYYILKTTVETALYKHAADKRVKESEERYRTLVEQSIDGIVLVQGKTVRFVNPALAKMFGFKSRDEMEGKNFLTYVAPEYRDLMENRSFEREAGKPMPEYYEFTALKKDGTPFDAELRVNLTMYRGEKVKQGIIRDISERKHAEEALRESGERYRAVFDNVAVGIDLVDRDGRFIQTNNTLVAMFGYTESELHDLRFSDITHPDDREISKQKVASIMRGEISGYRLEKRYIKKDGSTMWGDLSVSAIRDANGQHMATIGVITDITQRKRPEEELRESEERYRDLVENVEDLICMHDLQGKLLFVNEAPAKVLGYAAADLVGTNLSIYLAPEVRHQFNEYLAAIRNDGHAKGLMLVQTKRGDKRIWEYRNTLRTEGPRGAVVHGLARDITERKKAEEDLRESRERLQIVLDTIPAAVFWKDRDSVYVGANRAWLEAAGLNSSEDVVGKTDYDLPWDKNLANSYREHDRKVMESGIPEYDIIERYNRADGILAWARTSKIPLRDLGGNVVGILGTYEDITDRTRAEEALRESEQRFRQVADNAGEWIWEVDATGIYRYCSSAVERILGYSADELVGQKHFYDLFAPEVQQDMKEVALAAFERKEPFRNFVNRNIHKNGEIRILETSCSPILDGQGNLLGYRGTDTDVTERKSAEEGLRASEAQLSNAVVMAHLGHWEYDVAKDLFIFNDHFYKIFRTTAQEVGGYTMSSSEYARRFVHPDDISVVAGETQKAIETSDPLFSRQLEHRMLYADGELGYIAVRFFIVKDNTGRTIKTYGVNQDITERKRVEEALYESEARYRVLFNDSKDAVYMIKREGTIIEANQAYCDLFGYTREEIIGEDARIVYVNPSDRDRFVDAIETRGFLRDYPLTFKRKDGKEIDCLLTSSVRRAVDGTIFGYHGIIRDVTEQKSLQRQLLQAQKMEAIGTLAGGIAHDFNNLLTIVQGFSELLLSEKDQKHPEYEDLQKIFHAAKNGAELVQRLLMFSRKSELKPVPMNLNQEIVQVEKLLRRTIPRMVDIDLNLSADLPEVNADPSQIEQVLMNLAVNARDAMPDVGRLILKTSSVTLDEGYCRLQLEATPGQYVLLEVSDTGQGMDKETLEHIFEPFFTTKEMGRGTGLGLAMVHGIVKQHNGHITVHSEVGRGTNFRIYLPGLPDETESSVEDSGMMPAFGTETILLVDDEEFVRELGSRILTKRGYTVLRAVNGREALDLFNQERSKISLVILDLIMPEMGGTECLKELLEVDPHVNIIISSGYSGDTSRRASIDMGAKAFVTKPFSAKELLRAVRRVLDEG